MQRWYTWMLILFLGFFFAPFPLMAEKNTSVFVQNYTINDYQASCQNWGIAVSYEGTLYVANNSGLLTFDGNCWKTYPLPDQSPVYQVSFSNDTIYTRGENGDGFWQQDKLGQMIFTPAQAPYKDELFRKSYCRDTLPGIALPPKTTVIASTRRLHFIGTEDNGLFITNQQGDVIHHISTQNQLQDNVVRDICVQDENLVWIALDNGIAQIDINPPLFMLGKRSNIGQLQNAVSRNDTLYIRTNRGSFWRSLRPNDEFSPLNARDTSGIFPERPAFTRSLSELITNTATVQEFLHPKAIYPASQSLYWAVQENEIGLIETEQQKGNLKCRLLLDNYNLNLATRGQRIISLNDSLAVVSTMQGTFLLDTRKILSSSTSLTMPSFTRIDYNDRYGNRHVCNPDTTFISLPHDFQELNIFVGTTIFTPSHQFSYKLEGVSKDWSKWQKDGKISFLQLPEGSYQLHIRKYVTKGPFPEITLHIEVRPAWYNTVWAYLAYILILWTIIHLFLRHHLKTLHREELEQKEKEQQLEKHKLEQLKNEMLEQELQNKNNELTLQTSALVKRNQAIQTILEELEKQKETLGDRYPNKLYNKLHALMEDALENQADWLLFESYFNSAHQHFVDRLRETYSDLTAGDLRVCCLLRMNLSTKEIASLMNVSVRAIELRRYRLRKRLGLENETNLVDFLMGF